MINDSSKLVIQCQPFAQFSLYVRMNTLVYSTYGRVPTRITARETLRRLR